MLDKYDIIVVGAGHAGCEAAAAAANLGSKVLLITMNMQNIAQMSCNPAMGGVAKGQIVREIDALGGYSGIVTDRSTIQFKMLNLSKGPAMWSPRAQNDRAQFAAIWREMLENTPNLDFWQDTVTSLIFNNQTISGVVTNSGSKIYSKSVILTNGTFLNGLIHVGEKNFSGGRSGERASFGITEQLVDVGFKSGRMKTGTPPRLDGRSIDYSKMEIQPGDISPCKFSFTPTLPVSHQLPCYITYTSPDVHEILKEGFDKSPMFTGRIQGLGPRYCPSIEDKISRFSERDRHQLFVEPEGKNTVEVYLNGFSTSLPQDVQYQAIRKIKGLEKVKIFRPGYAIEYDFFPPTQLKLSLETNYIENLFFAGQINGTTGYEEAAAQGLIAGINAHRKINQDEPFILQRSEAYIGVLIDDLITKGTDEPYRMFTSRAEYRLILRQDNADIRLTPKAYDLGLVNVNRLRSVERKIKEAGEIIKYFKDTSVSPDEINFYLGTIDSAPINQRLKLISILSRPSIDISGLASRLNGLHDYLSTMNSDSIHEAEVLMKYQGYILREKDLAAKFLKLDNIPIDPNFDFDKVKNLSNESREKFSKMRPLNFGQASRISGVSPSDISVLLVHLGR